MPVLRKALEGDASAEVRLRVKQILAKLNEENRTRRTPSAEELLKLRAVEVLEHIGTPDAQDVLKSLAKGALEARLTQEAKASLERLAKRSAFAP